MWSFGLRSGGDGFEEGFEMRYRLGITTEYEIHRVVIHESESFEVFFSSAHASFAIKMRGEHIPLPKKIGVIVVPLDCSFLSS